MKKTDNQQAPYLFMAGIIALVAMVALVLNGSGSLEGAVPAKEGCMDDDPGDDRFKQGTVKVNGREYKDYCLESALLQQYCWTGDDAKTRRAFDCPNGCLNGACIR